MTPSLLANENWPRPALMALRDAGLKVQAVTEIMPAAADADVMRGAPVGERQPSPVARRPAFTSAR